MPGREQVNRQVGRAERDQESGEEREWVTLRLGVSSCLLGEEVRFDGGHKRDTFLLNTLDEWVEWVSVCPEVEMGLPVPRPALRLAGDWREPRMVVPKTGDDHTEAMQEWSRRRLEELAELDLDGYVLKRASPSCGLFRVKVYDHDQVPTSKGRGIFAAELTAAMPLLPMEEEGRLDDPGLRENFIERLFAYRRWRELAADPSPASLVDFHRDHKLTLMAHSPNGQVELGRLVAAAAKLDDGLVEAYGERFMEAMAKVATTKRHTNVLYHVLGFFKQIIDAQDKIELVETIEEYRLGRLPLVVPLTLFRHHMRRNKVDQWLRSQTYLNPYPRELMLRNHV